MTILHIDTSKIDEVTIGLEVDGVKKELKDVSRKKSSQTVLLLIDRILKENGLEPKDLTEIKVNAGPGSFTGLRVGITIANTLAKTLGIPINGRANHLVEPIYA
jgi:tRNA threonylcarbamoyladenosine biosynthesis protein TsaB